MFSVSFTLLQLFAVAAANYQASSEVSIPVSTGLVSYLTFFKEFGLDVAVWDTLAEAALALAVFGFASAMLTAYRKRNSKERQSQKIKSVSYGHLPSAAKRAERSRVAPACPGFQRSGAAFGLSHRSTGRGSQPEADALVAAVREGKSAQLPWLLDGALARSLAAASRQQSPSTQTDVATGLLHSALRACAANRCFKDAITAYEHMALCVSAGNLSLWSVLLYCIVEAKAFVKCKAVFENLCQQGEPSGHDFVNMVRCYVAMQDADGLRELLVGFRASGQFVDNFTLNRALAACCSSDAALHLANSLTDRKSVV